MLFLTILSKNGNQFVFKDVHSLKFDYDKNTITFKYSVHPLRKAPYVVTKSYRINNIESLRTSYFDPSSEVADSFHFIADRPKGFFDV